MLDRAFAITVRAACFLIAILLIAIATGLQLDRQSRRDTMLAPFVPALFRGQALAVLAQNAYEGGHQQQGLIYARELVRQRPIPSENLALLAQGFLASGDQARAVSALSLASQRGWRDLFTQQVMAASALQISETQVAAQRIVALWRLGERNAATKTMTLDLLNREDGLRNFNANLVRTDAWGTDFLIWAANVRMPLATWTTVGKALKQKKVQLDCGQLASPIRVWAMTGQPAGAVDAWRNFCAHGRTSEAGQFDFTQMSDAPGPFEWNYPTQTGLETDLVENAGSISLHYDYSEYVRVPLATRSAALKTGSHVVILKVDVGNATGEAPLALQVTCFTPEKQARRVADAWFDNGRASFQIPASGCAGQQLALIASHGAGTLRSLKILGASQ